MQQNEGTLLSLAAAVADGSDVNWELAESSAAEPEERRLIQQLRILASVGVAARAATPTWGPLEVRGELGAGTFGTVYRAWDTRLEREVALKLLHQESAGQQASTVVKEGRLLAQIRHVNVVTVHGADVFDGRVGIWMEFVCGRTLKEIVEEQGPFGPHEASLIGRDLCRALAAVHKPGFLHRDIKAQNVMREAGGRTVLMDFGTGSAAAAAATAPLAGTPVYLAPEVLAGGSPSFRSDLYSLGVLLFYLVSGEFPVIGRSLTELRENHALNRRRLLRDVRPDLPSAFVRVVDRATAVDPAQRPESAGAMEALLGGALGLRDEDAPASGIPDSGRLKTGTATATRWIAVAAVLVVLAAGSALWPRTDRGTSVVTAKNSVAILPFRNLTAGGPENDYFSKGITEDLVAQLAAIRDLRIISGTSVGRYTDGNTSPIEIGSDLGVATVLDGSVRRSGDRIRIASRLLDARTGQQLWSDTFDRELNDIFSLQSEISRRIAFALRGELSRLEAERLVAVEGRDFETFDLYLKGREQWALRTEAGLNRSVQYFQDAVERDPTYALAHAGMADAYTLMGMYGFLPRPYAFSHARSAAQKAVELSDSLAEGHAALGYVQKNQFEWAAAEASFKRAIQLKPGYAPAHHWYAIYLTQHGRFPEAIGEIKTAISLDPLSTGANAQFASVLMMARRYDDSIAQFRKTLALDAAFPAYSSIAQAYTYKGLFNEAREAADRAASAASVGSENQPIKADVGYLLAVSGRSAEALDIARELSERHHKTGEEVAVNIAAIYAGLPDADSAIRWLTEAQRYGDLELGYLKVEPRWDRLRDDARFTAILESLGFTR